MIGLLRGEVAAVPSQGTLLVDVHGVGYEVTVPTTLAATTAIGYEIQLFVHTHVRDDALVLFGFASLHDRDVFRLLIATTGIGPTTAIGALSTMTADALCAAIYAEDVDSLSTIPGIGKKTAARLVLELQGRLPHLDAVVPVSKSSVDLEDALRGLGYSAAEIRRALDGVTLPQDEEVALRMALRQLGSR
jgi:holliday junction DNA helicase RuvA